MYTGINARDGNGSGVESAWRSPECFFGLLLRNISVNKIKQFNVLRTMFHIRQL